MENFKFFLFSFECGTNLYLDFIALAVSVKCMEFVWNLYRHALSCVLKGFEEWEFREFVQLYFSYQILLPFRKYEKEHLVI